MATAPLSGGTEDWRPRLATMTVAEKHDLMEALWEDLTRNSKEFVAPSWHREILDSRRKEMENGTAVFEDWEDVKRELRSQL